MKIAICGAGGFGREVLPLVQAMTDAVCFVPGPGDDGEAVNGAPSTPLAALDADWRFVLGMADAGLRRRLDAELTAAGRGFASVIADTARLRGPSEIGQGAILCDHVIVTANAVIGRHFHANLLSYVAHDCVVGDFVTLAPRASINGNVVLEDDVYVGTGAVLKQGVRVGRGAVIGMGAVVTKDVAPGAVVVGNPARVLER